jgi:hypothetical protein
MPRSVARSVFHRRIVAIFHIGVRLFAAVMTLALNAADARVANHSARTHATGGSLFSRVQRGYCDTGRGEQDLAL